MNTVARFTNVYDATLGQWVVKDDKKILNQFAGEQEGAAASQRYYARLVADALSPEQAIAGVAHDLAPLENVRPQAQPQSEDGELEDDLEEGEWYEEEDEEKIDTIP